MTDADAQFCAGCGTMLGPPRTVPLPFDEPAATPVEPAAHAPEPVVELPPMPPPVPVAQPVIIDNRNAAYVGLVGAALAVIGAFQVWLRIRVASLLAPGSAETGWKGGDGRTIVVAAVLAAVAAGGLLIGRRDLWLKITLLITGGVTLVIALVNMVDAGSKAQDIEVRFGIPSGDVHAQVELGLYLVVVAGAALLAAGLRARTPTS